MILHLAAPVASPRPESKTDASHAGDAKGTTKAEAVEAQQVPVPPTKRPPQDSAADEDGRHCDDGDDCTAHQPVSVLVVSSCGGGWGQPRPSRDSRSRATTLTAMRATPPLNAATATSSRATVLRKHQPSSQMSGR